MLSWESSASISKGTRHSTNTVKTILLYIVSNLNALGSNNMKTIQFSNVKLIGKLNSKKKLKSHDITTHKENILFYATLLVSL